MAWHSSLPELRGQKAQCQHSPPCVWARGVGGRAWLPPLAGGAGAGTRGRTAWAESKLLSSAWLQQRPKGCPQELSSADTALRAVGETPGSGQYGRRASSQTQTRVQASADGSVQSQSHETCRPLSGKRSSGKTL